MTTATQTTSSNVCIPAPESKAIRTGQFNGAFAGFQRAFWHTLIAFGVTREVGHKMAMDFGSDLGRAMSKDADVAASVSKANKNNESYLKLSGKSVRVANSPAMEVNRLCVLTEAAYNEKLVTKRVLPSEDIMPDRLREYFVDCQDWATDKTFEE